MTEELFEAPLIAEVWWVKTEKRLAYKGSIIIFN